MPTDKPYKLAHLVHFDHDMSRRWYVEFYAWDLTKDALVRRRLFDPLNREHNLYRRLDIAEDMIRQINRQLRDGKVLGKEKIVDNTRRDVLKLSLLGAIEYVKQQKALTGHRKNYVDSFDRLKMNIERWLEYHQRKDFPVRSMDADDVNSFFHYLSAVRKIANKTYNNYRTDLATVFNFLLKRNHLIFPINPIHAVDKLPVNNRKHAALTDAQMDAIKAKCKELGYDALLLFIQVMFYTFGRPREVVKLKIENFDLVNGRVLFPAPISKTKRDDYVGLSPALKVILEKMNLANYPPSYYIFGKNNKPAAKPWGYLYFYNRNKKVFKALGLDKSSVRYSVYSYKHTGVISLYKATKDIKLVQSQCRHQSLEQTNVYLRDLGTLSDYDGLAAWGEVI